MTTKAPRPEFCGLCIDYYCSNWKDLILSNCRGCPYLHPKYVAQSIGRFK